MDAIARAFYELKYKIHYLELKGNAFQDFFSNLMARRYPADFVRVRPWGNKGDEKNDGYLKSKRMLFQVYAPDDMTEADAIRKIDEDFNKALPHWEEYFDCWVFVHNGKQGLGPEQTKKLLSLGKANPKITVIQWGFEEIRNELFELSDADLSALFGPPISRQDLLDLRSYHLKSVLDSLSKIKPPDDVQIRPVRGDKISKNQLSDAVATLLKAGTDTSNKVQWFFDNYPDKTLGDSIAESFRLEYQKLKADGLTPDEIFTGLLKFTGSQLRGAAHEEAAILAVLAFFFSECDIFEEP